MPLSADTRLGPYQVIAPLGAGGMGEVYRARDTRLGRDVALKVLPAELASDAARVARFEHEARAASALNHPNIITVYDVGREGGITYLVTELVDGEPLRGVIRHGPVPVRRLLDIAVQVADGLAAAHAAGIAHRDLKPENIMLTRDGRVKILDFGLAKQTAAPAAAASDATVEMTPTEPGMVVGTAGYMAPEQVRGLAVDGRADIFAFGTILHEMLTGKRAFAGATTADVMSAVLREEAPDLPASVPPALDAIVRHCLEKEPERRFQSARDLAFALRALSSGSGIAPAVAGKPAPAPTAIRRRAWAAGAIAAALAAGVALGWLLAPRRGVNLDAYRYTPLATDSGLQSSPAWSPDGRRIAYVRFVKGVGQVFVRDLGSPVPAQLTNSAEECSSPFWSREGTRVYYGVGGVRQPHRLYSSALAGGEPEQVLEGVLAAALSPDGRSLAVVRRAASGGADYELAISSPPGAAPRPYTPAFARPMPNGMAFLQFAPDGKKLLLWTFNGKTSELWLVPFPTGQPRAVLPTLSPVTLFWSMSWMPDSRRVVLAYETRGGVQHLHLADTASGSIHAISTGTQYDLEGAVSPDGKRLAVALADFNYDLVTLPLDGSPLRTLKSTSQNESAPAWSPVRPQYAYITNRTGAFEIWLSSPQEDADRPLVTAADFPADPTAFFGGPAFSPDGNRLAYTRRGHAAGLSVWISAASGGVPVRLNSSPASQYAPSWSPDGHWIAYFSVGGGMPRGIAKSRVGGEQPPVFLKESLDAPHWSPDGAWLSTVTDGGLTLVSPDGKTSRLLSKRKYEPHCWSKDGSWIYGAVEENHRMLLVSIDARTGAEKTVLDLGPDVNLNTFMQFQNPLSLAPDGKSIAATQQLSRADIWLLEGFDQR